MADCAVDLAGVYDTLTQARHRLFDWIRPLKQEHYTRAFPFGHQSLRGTLVEIARVEWMYARALRGEPIPPIEAWPISEERQPTFPPLEEIWRRQEPATRATLAEVTDWDTERVRRVPRPGRTTLVRSATRAQMGLQMLFHEVHHRAQAMAMLRHFGVEAQNLDYILLVQRAWEEPA